jgi:hypothetical protein
MLVENVVSQTHNPVGFACRTMVGMPDMPVNVFQLKLDTAERAQCYAMDCLLMVFQIHVGEGKPTDVALNVIMSFDQMFTHVVFVQWHPACAASFEGRLQFSIMSVGVVPREERTGIFTELAECPTVLGCEVFKC